MSPTSLVDEIRSEMQMRLATARRHSDKLSGSISSLPSIDANTRKAELDQVRDALTAMLHELRIIMFTFGRYRSRLGAKDGNELMKKWRDSQLSPQEKQSWDCAQQMRDCEVHREPIRAGPSSKGQLRIHTVGGGGITLFVHGWFARYTDEAGQLRSWEVSNSSCSSVLQVFERFTREFDSIT